MSRNLLLGENAPPPLSWPVPTVRELAERHNYNLDHHPITATWSHAAVAASLGSFLGAARGLVFAATCPPVSHCATATLHPQQSVVPQHGGPDGTRTESRFRNAPPKSSCTHGLRTCAPRRRRCCCQSLTQAAPAPAAQAERLAGFRTVTRSAAPLYIIPLVLGSQLDCYEAIYRRRSEKRWRHTHDAVHL